MKRHVKILILCLLCIAWAACSNKQKPEAMTPLRVRLGLEGPGGKRVDAGESFIRQISPRDSILIGDQLLLGVEIEGLEDNCLIAVPEFEKQDSVSEQNFLEFIGGWQIDTLRRQKMGEGEPSLLKIRISRKLAAFCGGEYHLPEIPIGHLSPNGRIDTLIFSPQVVKVTELPVDMETFKMNDIKGQIDYPVTFGEIFRKALPYLIAALLGAILGIVIFFVTRRLRRKRNENEPKEPAHIVALRKLDGLRSEELWKAEKQKQFYSGVTDAIKEYIADRFEFGAVEMTSGEIIVRLEKTEVPKELIEELSDLLARADYVKFAKYIASTEENAGTLPVAVKFVTSTYQSELEQAKVQDNGNEMPEEEHVTTDN